MRTLILFMIALLSAATSQAGVYHISPGGSDSTGNGTAASPWKTLSKAAQSVPDDGSTLLLDRGIYRDRISITRHFSKPCTIRARTPYATKLSSPENGNRALYLADCSNIVFEGLEWLGSGSTNGDYLIQISTKKVREITFRNCIIHDSYRNDLIKINDHASRITFTGCVFFNQANRAGDEHFDINTVTDILIEDSIFFNDYPGSGRPDEHRAHSFIVIKNSGSTPDVTREIMLRKNIFVNWSGKPDQAYILLGEDGKPFFEASDILIENNLFLHNGGPRIVGTFLFKGGLRNIMVFSNTITGRPDSRGFSVFSVVCLKIGANPPIEKMVFANNIFCDNSGGITRFSSTDGTRFAENGFRAINNLYWNGGKEIRSEKQDLFIPANDTQGILTDPGLPEVPREPILPRYDPERSQFLSGKKTIREEFVRLVELYGKPNPDETVPVTADPRFLPPEDILGQPRGKRSCVGCLD